MLCVANMLTDSLSKLQSSSGLTFDAHRGGSGCYSCQSILDLYQLTGGAAREKKHNKLLHYVLKSDKQLEIRISVL